MPNIQHVDDKYTCKNILRSIHATCVWTKMIQMNGHIVRFGWEIRLVFWIVSTLGSQQFLCDLLVVVVETAVWRTCIYLNDERESKAASWFRNSITLTCNLA